MVTFSLPGDFDGAEAGTSTPRSRPALAFSKRPFSTSSPFGVKRLGTPQAASSRKLLTTRDEVPSSSLNRSSMAAARNIFRESAISDSPPNVPFSPSLPQNTPKRVFAPGGTPHPSRVQREFTAHATPRGMAAPSTERDLFSMRIKSPPRELTGEVLANKVPKDWNSKGSIYADQFLAHLCPPDLDDEQRRQFFCILDLRRLKYAANEIFSKKDWKLNVINFAKEFEKSRSIILLRYGLYEFQNVKPSKDVLRRWRREHGLPEPNEDEVEDAESTPSKPTASKKRKANDDLAKDSSSPHIFANAGKRRVTTQDDDAPPAAAPAPTATKNKRKASVGEDQATQPNKLQKATPSSAKSLFEKIANKPTPKPSNEASAPAPKASLFGSNKPVNGSLARSVFNNTLKAQSGQAGPAGNGNIFGYLSDASSAKNSGVEADAESDTESDAEDSPEAGQSDEPSTIASGVGETSSQLGSSLFNTKPLSAAGFGAGSSSAGGTRESTPGRSLFDRVSTDQDGQLLRSEKAPEPVKSTPADQTWNPSTTPIKFAPSAGASQTSSLFGKTAAAAPSSVFAPKSTASSNIFGTSNQSQSSGKDSAGNTTSDEADKTGGESDKENDSHVSKKTATESKAPATQPSLGNSLFQLKPPSTASSNEGEPSKPTSSLFGTAPKTDAPAPSNLFGLGKPAVPVTQAPSLFGAKPSQPEKKSETETPLAAAPLFGAQSKSTLGGDNNPAASLFGIKSAANTTNLFGTATPASATSLFGTTNAAAETSKTSNPDPAPVIATPATPAPPLFSFGAKSATTPQAAAKPLFGIPTSPPGDSGANMFGSPMKQDEASPAKKPFAANQDSGTSKPIFSFGGTASTPSTNLFGASTTAASGAGSASIPAFGAGASTNGGSAGFGGFNFGADTSASSGNTFNNPFSSGSNGNNSSQPSASSTGGMFNFGGAPAATPAASSGGLFQFGNASGSTTPLGGSVFGGTQSNQTSAPLFGGSTTTTSAPAFNITAPVSQPTQTQNNPFAFGAGQTNFGGSLQPPVGGSSTTGTNSPFNLGGGSSLATTPAGGTPEPSSQVAGTKGGAEDETEEGEKHAQISLTDGADNEEEVLHDVRAKVLKFVPAGESSDGEEKKAKAKSPWSTQGVGPLRLLRHKETNVLRLLLRAEPRGHVALNRAVLPDLSYKSDEKYVKLTTSNEKGDGLETWMIQVKTKDLAKALAESLEKHKELNKK